MSRFELVGNGIEYVYNPKTDDTTDYEFKYTSIAKPEWDEISDEKVIDKQKIVIEYDYPLDNGPFYATYESDDGFSVRDIVHLISQTYHQIYEEEEETSEVKPGIHPVFTLNRGWTDGKYGIWGHSIDDLYFGEFTLVNDINLIVFQPDS